jgi:alpha-ketoglutarate-dependent taurine dioxygenase
MLIVSPRTAAKWADRSALRARPGMVDRSSRPCTSPTKTSEQLTRQIVRRRADGQGGPIASEFVPHMDYIFTSNLLRGICLYAQEVPKAGGHTFFIDLERAYGMLSDSMKSRLADLSAVHIGPPEFTDGTTRRLKE